MIVRNIPKSGFTLVELNIAIVFVALLLMAVAMTTMSVSRTYQYGVALKSINQLGREVVDQLRRDISSAAAQRVQYHAPGTDGVGRLCLGTVSYVFNTAESLNAGSPSLVDTSTSPNRPVNFARIDDRDSSWCQESAGVFIKNDIDSSVDKYTELLRDDSIPVAIHSMQVTNLLSSSGLDFAEGIVEVSIDIGTNETETTDGGVCKPPTSPDENFNNCAVRQFVTVVHIVGGQ